MLAEQPNRVIHDRIVFIEQVSGDDRYPYRQIDFTELANYRRTWNTKSNLGGDLVFALRGSNIEFPGPHDSEVELYITYVQTLEDLDDDDSSWDSIPVFAHRLIAYEAALIGLVSEDSEAGQHADLTNRVRSSVLGKIERRNTATPDYVRFVPE
jgi:hypothetical protein